MLQYVNNGGNCVLAERLVVTCVIFSNLIENLIKFHNLVMGHDVDANPSIVKLKL